MARSNNHMKLISILIKHAINAWKEYDAVPQTNFFPVRKLLHFSPEVYHWEPIFSSNRDTCLGISTSCVVCPLRQTQWILNIRMSASNGFSRWNSLNSQFESSLSQMTNDCTSLSRSKGHPTTKTYTWHGCYEEIIPEAPFFINWGRSYEKNLSLWPSLLNPKEFWKLKECNINRKAKMESKYLGIQKTIK